MAYRLVLDKIKKIYKHTATGASYVPNLQSNTNLLVGSASNRRALQYQVPCKQGLPRVKYKLITR